MFKSVTKIINELTTEWSKKHINYSFPFMDDLIDFNIEFEKVAIEVTENQSTKVELITFYTLNNVSRLMFELQLGIIVGQRISFNQYNRSIIENFIILTFILEYGEEAAKVYIANDEIAFQKFVKKVNPDLSDSELQKVNSVIQETRDNYPNISFDNSYKWTNSFIGRRRNQSTSLFEISNKLFLEKEYKRLSLFHQQVHSSSGLAHYMNIKEYDNHIIYVTKILSAVEYSSKVLKLVASDSQLKNFEGIEDRFIAKYEKMQKNFK